MKFKLEYEFEKRFDVDDKFSLTEEQIEELKREFFTILDSNGFMDLVEEEDV